MANDTTYRELMEASIRNSNIGAEIYKMVDLSPQYTDRLQLYVFFLDVPGETHRLGKGQKMAKLRKSFNLLANKSIYNDVLEFFYTETYVVATLTCKLKG